MLQAKTIDGRLITPAKLSRQQLSLHRSKQFFCPVCEERVILKAGLQVVPHFAHLSSQLCPSTTGGEGPYHEQGKLILYEWLTKQSLDVQLEAYLPEINQQPDLLITVNQKKIAIEFQCSRIPTEIIRQRNLGYLRANIQPIWILSARLFKQRTAHVIHMDHFTRQFIQQFSKNYPLTIYYFCPLKQSLLTAQHVYLLSTSSAFAQLQYKSLKRTNFLGLFNVQPLNTTAFIRRWQQVKKDFRTRPRNRHYGRTFKWYDWLYKRQTHVQYLPSVIYLPVQAQIYMRSPLWEWQSRLCLDILNRTSTGSLISLSFVKKYFNHSLIPSRLFPLINQLPHPIDEYFNRLQLLNLLHQKDPNTFVKIKELKFHTHVEQAIVADQRIIENLVDDMV